MDNLVSNIGSSDLKKSLQTSGSSLIRKPFKASNVYLQNLKNDVYSKSVKTSPSSVYSLNPINQYNPKLLLKAYANPYFIKNQIDSNVDLQEIMKKYNLSEINTKNLLDIVDTHLTTTTFYAMKIANNLGLSYEDKKLLEQACVFHDFGKLLIPDKIINKPGPLTAEEKEIMDLHAELGYQLLKNTGLNERVLNMVRNHHKCVAENNDLLGQILSVADIYSALREERVYKKPMSVNTALDILDQKALNGEVSTEVVDSLNEVNYSRI